MSKEVRLGRLADDEQKRDAIHIAVAPVVAGQELGPGEHVGFITSSQSVVGRTATTKIGIVDPFLPMNVMEGQRFLVLLYPNTITSLRHDWTHPMFLENCNAD